VEAVHQSVGGAIPGLLADPATAEAGQLAADAMISAAKETTGIAAGILVLGVLATLALPPEPVRRRGPRWAAATAAYRYG
jgi:hypothetical protein